MVSVNSEGAGVMGSEGMGVMGSDVGWLSTPTVGNVLGMIIGSDGGLSVVPSILLLLSIGGSADIVIAFWFWLLADSI
jgi:hypothetical protein